MANVKGLKLPLGVDKTGRTRTVQEDEQAFKIIGLGLADTDSVNAFQQNLGLGSQHVFNLNSPVFRARITATILRQFSEYEDRDLYKLVRGTFRWTSSDKNDGSVDLSFKYLDIETDEERTFSRTFAPKGTP